jgi:hypothetical protein
MNEGASFLGERICREFFEQLFGRCFPTAYPKWLRTVDNAQLELDGYCSALKLAFEHHGRQHFSTKGKYGRTRKAVEAIQVRDRRKRQLCEEHKVVLIEIPEIPKILNINEVKDYIKKECKKKRVPLPRDFDETNVNVAKAYDVPSLNAKLGELKQIARERGGLCLSSTYKGSKTKLLFECARGHQWRTTPYIIQKGSWCPKCSYPRQKPKRAKESHGKG